MRRREIELITALAEGRLEDEREARALIETSAEARAEYEMQTLALEALAGAPPVEMTDMERATLRRDVWSSLTAGPTTSDATNPWYYRWSYAAAALILLVGVFAALGQGGDGERDTAAFEEIGTATDEAAQPATTSAAGDYGGGDVAENTQAAEEKLSTLADRVRAGDFDQFGAALSADDEAALCLESAGLEGHRVIGEETLDRRYLIAMMEGEELGPSTTLVVIDAETCEIAYQEG